MRVLRRALVPFAAAVLGAGVGGVALGSIPGEGGTISGCYSKFSGALRVINAPTQTCSKSQVPIAWSQTGPSGVSGYGVIQQTVEVPNNGPSMATVADLQCNSGQVALSGGYSILASTETPIPDVTESESVSTTGGSPGSSDAIWQFVINNSSQETVPYLLTATCGTAN
jgi:hypothetical protein